MNNILVTSEYRPQYIVRECDFCPHCKGFNSIRTNRYLFRCVNYTECGRYW